MSERTTAGPGSAEPSAAAEDAIRPFHIEVPEEELVELRRRVQAARWPERETVADQSQGVQLATIQSLAHYWASDYDFRRFEARLNAFPQFITEIDGLDIHFLHVRSPHEHALPLIITHGWPGSVIEMLNVIGPRSDPPDHGGNLTRDEVLDNITLTWVTNTEVSSGRLYWENTLGFFEVRSTKATTSPPGKSQTSSPPRSAPPSDPYGDRRRYQQRRSS